MKTFRSRMQQLLRVHGEMIDDYEFAKMSKINEEWDEKSEEEKQDQNIVLSSRAKSDKSTNSLSLLQSLSQDNLSLQTYEYIQQFIVADDLLINLEVLKN